MFTDSETFMTCCLSWVCLLLLLWFLSKSLIYLQRWEELDPVCQPLGLLYNGKLRFKYHVALHQTVSRQWYLVPVCVVFYMFYCSFVLFRKFCCNVFSYFCPCAMLAYVFLLLSGSFSCMYCLVEYVFLVVL